MCASSQHLTPAVDTGRCGWQRRVSPSRVDASELDRIVDRNWDPPVSAGVRLVSVIDDSIQHAGQALYLRGMIERRG